MDEFRRGFLWPMAVGGGIVALIFCGKNLSIAIITGAVVVALTFIAGVRLRYLAAVVLLGIAFSYIAIRFEPMRMRRILSYRDPEKFQEKSGYQLWYSQLAMGSGGMHGLGLTASRLKQLYLPEAHTDFIVAIIGEELGFAAVGLLMLGYIALVAVTFWIAALAADRQGALTAMGIGLSIGMHAFINVGVVSGFCPTTGVTAPFLSYGGSSVIASLAGVGLLLSVSRVAELASEERDQHSSFANDYGPVDVDDLPLQT